MDRLWEDDEVLKQFSGVFARRSDTVCSFNRGAKFLEFAEYWRKHMISPTKTEIILGWRDLMPMKNWQKVSKYSAREFWFHLLTPAMAWWGLIANLELYDGPGRKKDIALHIAARAYGHFSCLWGHNPWEQLVRTLIRGGSDVRSKLYHYKCRHPEHLHGNGELVDMLEGFSTPLDELIGEARYA